MKSWKCWICGKEMENTIGGCYRCKDCGTGLDDLVFRKNAIIGSHSEVIDGYYQQGWVCPKCGGVYSPYQGCCPNCTPAKSIEITCETNKPYIYIPPTQTISKVNETHSNLDSKIHAVGTAVDTSDRMNNFK